MAFSLADIFNAALYVLRVYIIPNGITLIIALLSVSFAVWVVNRRKDYLLRAALRAEMLTNIEVSKRMVDYTQLQLSSDATVQPMPRYYDSAYKEYKRAGLLAALKGKTLEEIENLYLYQDSVNEAGRRQEDLAYGPSSAFPDAHNLRLQNLQYISDTVHNVIMPYSERLRHVAL